jgi:hypothetical protein
MPVMTAGFECRQVTDRLNKLFDTIESTVHSRYPTVSAARNMQASGRVAYEGCLTFMYDRVNQRYEDALIELTVAPGSFFGEAPRASTPPEAVDRDVAKFDMMRGDGRLFGEGALGPMTLPDDRSSQEYGDALLRYVDRIETFVVAHLPALLEALAVPFTAEAD